MGLHYMAFSQRLCFSLLKINLIAIALTTLHVAIAPGAMAMPNPQSPSSPSSRPAPSQPAQTWRAMTETEQAQAWNYVLNSPLGIAALNQLAIEGFIDPTCEKTFYTNEAFGGFQTLLRVECPTERGVSIANSYSEMRVIFNRFEDSIESFDVERVYGDRPATIQLPDA
jgi:hypothetical protein